MAGAEDEVLEMGLTAGVTAGAVVLERHAMKKHHQQGPLPDYWDRNSIRQMREQAKWDDMRERVAVRKLVPPISHEQFERIKELSEQFGSPAMAVGIEEFTSKEAQSYISHLEGNVYSGPTKGEHVTLPEAHSQEMRNVDDFMDSLEAKHGHKDLGPEATRWAQSTVPATAEQLKALKAEGIDPTNLGLSQTTADSMLKHKQARDWELAQQQPTPLTPAAKNAAKPVFSPGKNQHR